MSSANWRSFRLGLNVLIALVTVVKEQYHILADLFCLCIDTCIFIDIIACYIRIGCKKV